MSEHATLIATLPLRAAAPAATPRWRVLRYDLNLFAGIVFPLTAGAALFGWRGLAAVAVLCVSTWMAMRVWSRISTRPEASSPGNLIMQAILLAFVLPADWFDMLPPAASPGAPPGLALGDVVTARWPLLVASGVLLAALNHVVGWFGTRRVHPLLMTILILWVCFPKALEPDSVLTRSRAFVGDVMRSAPALQGDVRRPEGWVFETQEVTAANTARPIDARTMKPAARTIQDLTRPRRGDRPVWVTTEAVVRDELPPLEDLIVGGQPSGIGLGSAIAVVIGGLFLIYRGVVDYRLPLAAVLIGYAALLVAPLPILSTNSGTEYRWLAGQDARVTWPLAITFANYALLASPLLFTAFFLGSLPGMAPVGARAAVAFAVLMAVLAVPFSLYISMQFGPYLALAVTTLLTPTLEYRLRCRPLI